MAFLSYSMTGWRSGYAVGEPRIIGCTMKQGWAKPLPIQQQLLNIATIEALTLAIGRQLKLCVGPLKNLNTIYPLLAQNYQVWGHCKPQGAFYLFPNVQKAMKWKVLQMWQPLPQLFWKEVEWPWWPEQDLVLQKMTRLNYATIWKHWMKLFSVWSNLWSAKAWGKISVFAMLAISLFAWQLALYSSKRAEVVPLFLSLRRRTFYKLQVSGKMYQNSIQWQWFS